MLSLMVLLSLLLLTVATRRIASTTGIVSTAVRWSQQAANMSEIAQRAVEVVQQVAQGPARGRSLMLHLDPALPGVIQDTILMLQPLFLATPPLHLAIFLKTPINFIALWSRTTPPRELLIVTLNSDPNAASLLMQSFFNSVHSLTLLTPLPAKPGSLVAYTLLPFCSPLPHFLGRWSLHAFPTWESLFPDRFSTDCHTTFRIAAWLADPLFVYHSSSNNQTKGVCITMLQVLAAKLNFSYTMTENAVFDKWGALEGGVWVGLLGAVFRGDYNFTIHGLFFSQERTDAFDAGEVIFHDSIAVFLKNPSPLPEWLSLARIFSLDVWMALIASFFLLYCCCSLQVSPALLGQVA